jgi:uncharacterized protein
MKQVLVARRAMPRRLKWALASAATAVLVAAPGGAAAFDYAPVNCSKADSAAEGAVCKSYSLGQAEARMATLYGIATALVAMGQRGAIADAQVKWLSTRQACGGNTSCLEDAYRNRIAELTRVLDDIVARGPF